MITVEHLTKKYGSHLAVDDLSFTIEEGHVYGFLGPNGAGKSTTMNIITGCLSATSGSVYIDGHDIFEEPEPAKRLIGYLPEQPPLYMNESPRDYLSFVGEAKGLRGGELQNQIDSVICQTGIEKVAHRRISQLSKGYKQRVGIAQALLGSPKVIILDEPTVGLDPLQIMEIRDLVKELGRTHTVLFSSHILSEVQAICDQILILSRGRLAAFDTPDNLEKQRMGASVIHMVTDLPEAALTALLAPLPHITSIAARRKENGLVSANIETEHPDPYTVSRSIFFAFAEAGAPLLEMSLKKTNLEDIFLELTESPLETPKNEQEEKA